MTPRASAGAVALCALALPTLAQDSTSLISAYPGDTLDPHDVTEQVNDYVLDLAALTSSSGRVYGVAPLAKTSMDSDQGSLFYGARISCGSISNDTLFGAPFVRSSYMNWNAAGAGVNGNASLNTPGSPVNTAALVGNQFGFTLSEYSTQQVTLNSLGQVIAGTANYEVDLPSRLYVSRVVAATNSPDWLCNVSQFGMGGVTNDGTVVVRADNFTTADCGPILALTGNNYFRVDTLARSSALVNYLATSGTGDPAATLQLLANSATTHSPAAMISGSITGGQPVFLGSNFNGECVYGSTTATATTAHVGGASTRGTVSFSQHNFPALFPGSVLGTGAQIVKHTVSDTLGLFGLNASGAPTGTLQLTLPAVVSDPTDGFSSNIGGAGQPEFANYYGSTPFRGGNGPIAVGEDQAGRLLAAAQVHHPTWVSNANHNNLIAVARHSGGTTTWVVAAHTFNATGKDVYGLFGTQVIGHLVGQDAAATVAGPSLGSPMMDSVGNLYFTARVLLNGASFFDNALVRAVYDATSFSYKLELVLIEGDVVTGGNSGVNYKIRSLSVSNGNSSDPSTTWSHSINQDAFNLANPSLLDGASTQTIGGIVVNANIIYDVDNNGSYDTLFSTPGSPDQDYNVLLYVTSADDCNQNGVPDDLDVADGTSQDQDGNGIPDECAGGVVGTAFCFGDGSGSFCPCGNNGNAGEGCANSTGVGAILFGTGSDSVSADDLVFNAQQLRPNQPALLFNGLNQVNGGNGSIFGDGLRCAGGSVKRMGVRVPDAGGNASWGPALSAVGVYTPGDTRSFQVWYRDPAISPCGSNFNLSNGVTITFLP
ncbi:MAG: hypothetical protein H6828_12295 [Planctomycetes bacterium]|nr:hypothetical protein [Planctomycetota bacterium]